MKQGLDEKAPEIEEKSKGIAERIKDAFSGVLGIFSPSRVGKDLGAYFGEGIALGIEGMADRTAAASAMLAKGVNAGATLTAPDLSGIGAPSVPQQAVGVAGAAPVGGPSLVKKTENHFHGGIHQADLSGTLRAARRDSDLAALALGGEQSDLVGVV